MFTFLMEARKVLKYPQQYQSMILELQPTLLNLWTDNQGTWLVFSNTLDRSQTDTLVAADASYIDPTGGDYIISAFETIRFENTYYSWLSRKAGDLTLRVLGRKKVGSENRVYFSNTLSTAEVNELETHEAAFLTRTWKLI